MKDVTQVELSEVAPVRYGKFPDRVLKPYPLDAVTIIGMGATAIQFPTACLDGYYSRNKRQQIWTINNAAYAFKSDLCWSIHDDKMMHSAEIGKAPEGQFYLQDLECPIVTSEAMPDYPNSLEFPLHEVFKHFNETYFTHTTPYMIAFALMCFELSDAPEKRLFMYGCDYDYLGNKSAEAGKSNTEYWLGRARERGVEVYIPPQSQLLQMNMRRATGIYGYSLQPIASHGADGRVNGVKEFVDPAQFRLDKQVIEVLRSKLQLPGNEDQQRIQAQTALTWICTAFDIDPLVLMAALQGKAQLVPKAGAVVEI